MNFQHLLAALAAAALGQDKEKPIDYEHPLTQGVPIKRCCKDMGVVEVYSHPCLCPDKRHQGAIFRSVNCSCPDRFMPLEDMSKPPEFSYEGGEIVDMTVVDGQTAVYQHVFDKPKEAKVNRFEDLN